MTFKQLMKRYPKNLTVDQQTVVIEDFLLFLLKQQEVGDITHVTMDLDGKTYILAMIPRDMYTDAIFKESTGKESQIEVTL